MYDFLEDSDLLITGGTGSFGQLCAKTLLEKSKIRRLVIFSRDEYKQYNMKKDLKEDPRLRFYVGDVRDYNRVRMAFEGINYVIHAAALKQVPVLEENPFEAVKTNIYGAQNVIEASLATDVLRVLALSTDKASSPINLYGATKLVSDKLFVDANAYVGPKPTKFAVVRYGNVMGSRGSVVPLFQKLSGSGRLPITDMKMTRFWITLQEAVDFVLQRLNHLHGGTIYVPKIPSIRITDLAKAISPSCHFDIIGIRPGEKLHEQLISLDEARMTFESLWGHYEIHPNGKYENLDGVGIGFSYTSDNNRFLTVQEIKERL